MKNALKVYINKLLSYIPVAVFIYTILILINISQNVENLKAEFGINAIDEFINMINPLINEKYGKAYKTKDLKDKGLFNDIDISQKVLSPQKKQLLINKAQLKKFGLEKSAKVFEDVKFV